MPAARYQHGAVFVGARLHISGGAVGGGRMVDDGNAIVVLDTAAGTWCTQGKPVDEEAPLKEWERRCEAPVPCPPSICVAALHVLHVQHYCAAGARHCA